MEALVEQFHRAVGLPVRFSVFGEKSDGGPWKAERTMRRDLLREEYQEYLDAEDADDLVGIADALGDMVYVIYGTALTYGINLPAVLKEIHRSNMSKLGEDGEPLYREDGKVLKGPNFTPPNLEAIIYA